MKKILLFASALAGLFLAASCQQENLEPQQMAGTVKFTVEAPGAIATKTIADGMNVNEVHYEVYKNVEGVDHALLDPTSEPMAKGVVAMENKKANITLDLLQDQEYTVIFWAQVEDAGHYDTSDLRCVAFEGEVDANDESRAAFFKRFDFDTYEHKDYANIILRRPFAQLNLLTTMESLKPVSTGQTSGYEIDAKESEIIVTGLATSFNTVEGVGIAYDQPLTFAMAATPEEQGQATLTVNGKDYHYVSMNYMFVPVDAEDGSATVELKYEIVTDKGSIKHEIVNVPIKENYRTNVIGNLFTKESKFEIIVDAEFDGQNLVDVWDGREVSEPAIVDGKYVISTAAELAWLSAAVNGTLPPVAVNGVAQPTPGPQKFSGKTFVLAEDIDLNNDAIELPNVTWTPIGANGRFEGTFDGQNHTITNLVVKTEGTTPAGLFGRVQSGTVKNVTVKNADVQGHASAAVVVAHGVCAKIENCHVEDAVVVSTPVNGDEGNNVGAIAGFLGADGGSAYVKNCTVKNVNITGYRKVGGVVGAANQAAVVTGNSIEASNVTADQTAEYKDVKAADLGAIVGYKHAQATVPEKENTATYVDLFHKVDSIDELKNAAAGAQLILAEGTYDINEALSVACAIQAAEGKTVTINAAGNTITAGNNSDYAFIAKPTSTLVFNDANIISNGGGIAASSAGSKVIFNSGKVAVNTTNTSGRYNFYVVGQGTEVTINGGEFSFNKPTNKRAYVYVGAGAKVNITGGTFGKASTRSGYTAGILGEGEVFITGGTFGFDPTKWVAVGYTAKKDNATNTWTVVSLSEGDNLKNAVAVAGATVNVAAGTYTFPSSSIAAGVTINCEEGTVFTGNSKLNINGATVIGATFSNPGGTAADQTINGTFKNCTFEGTNALRWCYAGETCVFEDCVFSGSTYGVHFDGGDNKQAYFKNCTFSGFNAFAAAIELVTFDGCTFVGNGKSGYNGANLWGSAKLINTKFEFDGSTANEWIDMIGLDKTYEMTGCTLNGGSVFNAEKIFSRNPGTKITIDGVLYTWAEGDYLVDENGNVPTTSAKVMQAALNSGADVTLNILNDIAGDVTVPQNAGVNAVINGNGKKYEGVIVVDGKSATYTTAGLTIKDLTFNASSISADACIRLGDGTNATRYTCNVTVENCTFDVPGAVGVKSYTGGDKNLKLSGCTATAAAHSLLQVAGVDKVLVEGCTINSKNGMNFNNSVEVTINECNADVKGYAARFGAGSAANGAAETYTISNSTLKSACEDGDAVIVLRGTADKSTLTITDTTLEGTLEITNNAVDAQVIR